jgi:hypothetical protein
LVPPKTDRAGFPDFYFKLVIIIIRIRIILINEIFTDALIRLLISESGMATGIVILDFTFGKL